MYINSTCTLFHFFPVKCLNWKWLHKHVFLWLDMPISYMPPERGLTIANFNTIRICARILHLQVESFNMIFQMIFLVKSFSTLNTDPTLPSRFHGFSATTHEGFNRNWKRNCFKHFINPEIRGHCGPVFTSILGSFLWSRILNINSSLVYVCLEGSVGTTSMKDERVFNNF